VSRRLRQVVFLVSTAAMLAYCATHLQIGNDITNFMPDGGGAKLAALSRKLANSELTRTMVISVGAEDPATATAAAAELEELLVRHPEVAWTRASMSDDIFEEARDIYFPRRFYFASAEPEVEIPAALSAGGLKDRAEKFLRELQQPTATFMKPMMADDPLGLFRNFLDEARRSQEAMPMRDGRLVSPDGKFALILLATVHSHFASNIQGPFLDDLRAMTDKVQAAYDRRLTIETSGANRIAVRAEQSIRRDIYWIGACTFTGVAILFFLFFRSVTPFLLALLPALFGMIAGTSTGLFVLGSLDGLSIAFSAALLGVAVDYSIHVINHHALVGDDSAHVTVRRLSPTLLLGAATTMASFAGLLMTSSPAFRELGLVSIAGIGAAIGATFYILPDFLVRKRTIPPLSRRVARGLRDAVEALRGRRRALAIFTIGTSVVSLLLLPNLRWGDDLSRLGGVDPTLIEEDVRVRSRLPNFETGRFVIALGSDAESALRTNDLVFARLQRLVRDGSLGAVRSLHQLLWSEDLQRRNWDALQQYDVRAKVDVAFSEAGFRPGAFDDAFDDLDAPPPPLTLGDLRNSAFAPLVSTLALPIGDQFAILTYLRDVHSLPDLEGALADIEDAIVFDQREFVNQVYTEFRTTTLRQVLIGSFLVALVLILRYRAWRPAVAAILPSLLVVVVLLGSFAAFGVEANLLHVISLMMVMGMGVDYGVFLVDTSGEPEAFGSTMLSLLLSCLTTIFVFGALAISEHPALRAMGVTTGSGVLLAFIFAPISLLIVEERRS